MITGNSSITREIFHQTGSWGSDRRRAEVDHAASWPQKNRKRYSKPSLPRLTAHEHTAHRRGRGQDPGPKAEIAPMFAESWPS